MLSDFRSWLKQVATPGDRTVAPADSTPAPAEPIDLHTLLAQFVALRHEVNLQTKASRAQQEQNTELLAQLTETLEALQQTQEKIDQADSQVEDEKLRPLFRTLVDLYDALALAQRELLRVQETILTSFKPLLLTSPEPLGRLNEAINQLVKIENQHQRISFWKRWFAGEHEDWRSSLEQVTRNLTQHTQQIQEQLLQIEKVQPALNHILQVLVSVSEGYTMSLQRVERALQQHGLEAIPAKGQPFDPEQMEVLEVVTGSGSPAGEVVEEVRRGYLWRGRVFRYAQVRVAKS